MKGNGFETAGFNFRYALATGRETLVNPREPS